jgi:hypothetical protein
LHCLNPNHKLVHKSPLSCWLPWLWNFVTKKKSNEFQKMELSFIHNVQKNLIQWS